jgi:hypothetical protein
MSEEPTTEATFDFQLEDGRVAHCWRATQQEYADCTFSAGLVDGIDPDTFYLCLQRSDDGPMMIFMRPDEAAAILYVLTGAAWSAAMIDHDAALAAEVKP